MSAAARAIDPISIYLHVPFCEQKCAYCDFFTITDPARQHPLAATWLDLCLAEAGLLTRAGDLPATRPIQSIFFGGGTPSLLAPDSYAVFLAQLRECYRVERGAEVTLETQPGTVSGETLQAFAEAGITRFSIGVQTFDADILQRTGRRHTVEQARDAITGALATGAIVSIDLICAFPGQTLDQWASDLEQALSFDPAHISVYELTYHAGTEFHRQLRQGRIAAAPDDLRVAMFENTHRMLTAAGFEHYEISNYARSGARSVHNENYWKLGDFVGLGAGAHSFVYPHRFSNANAADAYAAAIGEGRLFRRSTDTDDPLIFMLENLQMTLRRSEGIGLADFDARFGGGLLGGRMMRLRQLEQDGLLQIDGDRLTLTDRGRLHADSITEFLL